ncbi:hypothetical protein R6Q57_008388 [Mikania cordata]
MRFDGSGHFHQGFDRFTEHVASDDCEDSDHEDDEDTTTHPSQRDLNVAHPPHDRFHKPFIRRVGRKFANTKVHRLIRKIFDASFEGPWSTFKEVPKPALDKMFETFRTSFSWEPTEEFANRQGFENVLRDRYSDIMLEMRNESTNNARASGHFIINGQDNFNIMCDFPPKLVSQDVWRQLCLIWNTEEWAKNSERGRNNRMRLDSSGAISRHTGGSVGYDEHRIPKNPHLSNFSFILILKKESKAKYWVGYYDENPEWMDFCTDRSKEAYESYSFYMVEKYDEDETQHLIGDIDLSQGEKKQSFGIGFSDRHFILTGTPSSSIGSTPSNVMFEQSQQEVQSQVDSQKEQIREEIKKERPNERGNNGRKGTNEARNEE